jgi:putative endonuclease
MNKQQLTRKQLGVLGEDMALVYLQQQQYRIIERNWRCRTGEIDLIVQDGDLLVFVEVRTRSGTHNFGTPQESINARKQQQVAETAQFYALRHHIEHVQYRFDVVAIITSKEGIQLSLEHIPNAF